MNFLHGNELLVASVFLLSLVGGSDLRAAEERTTSFDCTKDRTALASIVCSNQKASAAERRTTIAYSALYFFLEENRRASFRNDHVNWVNSLIARCTPAQSPLQKMLGTTTAPSRECVTRSYMLRAELYRRKLHASALEETNLSLSELRRIQSRLVELKFLSGNIDGVFGVETRLAIRNYQASIGHPQANFLTGDERNMLFAPASTATQTLTPAPAPAQTSISTQTPISAPEPSPEVPSSQTSTGESNQTLENRLSNMSATMPAGGEIGHRLVQDANPSAEPEVTKQAGEPAKELAEKPQPSYLTQAVPFLLITIFACIGFVLMGIVLLMRLHHGREQEVEDASPVAPHPNVSTGGLPGPNQISTPSQVVAPTLVPSVD